MKKYTLFQSTIYHSNELSINSLDYKKFDNPIIIELREYPNSEKTEFRLYGLTYGILIKHEFSFRKKMIAENEPAYWYLFTVPQETYNFSELIKLKERNRPTVDRLDYDEPYECTLDLNFYKKVISVNFKVYFRDRILIFEFHDNKDEINVAIDAVIIADEILRNFNNGSRKIPIVDLIRLAEGSDFDCDNKIINQAVNLINAFLYSFRQEDLLDDFENKLINIVSSDIVLTSENSGKKYLEKTKNYLKKYIEDHFEDEDEL